MYPSVMCERCWRFALLVLIICFGVGHTIGVKLGGLQSYVQW
jgi:hypothetical protein